MKVSILGCGWLGFTLGKTLAQKAGFKVNGSTTSIDKLNAIKSAGMDPYRVDLENHIPGGFFQCDIVVITVPPSVEGYERKMKTLVALLQKRNIQKTILISTTSVYPNTNKEVVEADADYVKSSHSGITMLAIEDLFRADTSFQSTILRFAGLYGPGREPGRFLAGKSDLKGMNNPVNLIHQEDCVQIIIKIIEKEIWGETFNACSDEHPTRGIFYKKAAEALGLSSPSFSDEGTPYKIVNSEKLKAALPYRFHHSNPLNDL
ncbi:MAG: SDR family oxidoreductase [Bacteroidota bacterium]